jgi:hypothetical protein
MPLSHLNSKMKKVISGIVLVLTGAFAESLVGPIQALLAFLGL